MSGVRAHCVCTAKVAAIVIYYAVFYQTDDVYADIGAMIPTTMKTKAAMSPTIL